VRAWQTLLDGKGHRCQAPESCSDMAAVGKPRCAPEGGPGKGVSPSAGASAPPSDHHRDAVRAGDGEHAGDGPPTPPAVRWRRTGSPSPGWPWPSRRGVTALEPLAVGGQEQLSWPGVRFVDFVAV
jgi:hypothetical protein